ncbi:MAG: amidohydrolase/deacetylase family metallohydrolase [Chloroflexi bacterium]|nr:amidohydrolase/deacetylase family metallohydrolase [Chloroflexota bacterium]
MYDLLIKGGRVIDPAQSIDGALDIAVTGDRIALVGKDIPRHSGRQVLDASGKIVTPGLIDLHCHVSGSLIPLGVDPDVAGVNQGVTTVVDGGSTGEACFGGFPRYVIPSSRTRVFCFLHLSSQGLSIMPELRDWDEVNLEAMTATIQAHRGLIKGVKLRLLGNIVARDGIKVVETAKKVARQFGVPLMVHIGDYSKTVAPTLTQETLDLMEKGDILSHIYTAHHGGVMGTDKTVFPELRAAADRGVILDVAMGKNNFSFRVAREMMKQGILPTTLSTDLGTVNLKHPVFGMTVTLSKFLALGLGLRQLIEMSTVNPARALGEESRIGSLKLGMEADVSILEILSGKWRLEDSEQKTIDVDRLISPSMTIKAGQVIIAQPAVQPQPVE